MRWTSVVLAAAVAFGLVGCGDTKSDTKKLTLSIPSSVELKPGESKKVKVSVDRKGFDDDVKLTIDGLPEGVSAEEKSPMVKKGDKDIEVTIKAAESAPAIEKKDVMVKASGGGLSPESAKLTMTVKK